LHPAADRLWLVGPADAASTVRALRGFGYLRELLRRPGQPIPALDLVAAGGGGVVQAGLGDLLDQQALQAYRRRLRDLEHDLAEAEEWADIARRDALHAEHDALIDQLTAATGLRGRARTTTGGSQERARVAATKAINAAIDRITSIDGPLGRHLRTAIRTGLTCTYQPDSHNTPDWILD
jgi:hypothetical protein